MPSIRAKKKVNVYSESSLNMPTNERKITQLLPLPMLHTVRLSQFIGTNAHFAKGRAQRRAYHLWRQQIFEAAPSHHNVRLQVAGDCGLISPGEKYYLACLHSFQSSTRKHSPQQELKLICTYLVVRAKVCSGERSSYWPATCLGKVFCSSREGRDLTETTNKVRSIAQDIIYGVLVVKK